MKRFLLAATIAALIGFGWWAEPHSRAWEATVIALLWLRASAFSEED